MITTQHHLNPAYSLAIAWALSFMYHMAVFYDNYFFNYFLSTLTVSACPNIAVAAPEFPVASSNSFSYVSKCLLLISKNVPEVLIFDLHSCTIIYFLLSLSKMTCSDYRTPLALRLGTLYQKKTTTSLDV